MVLFAGCLCPVHPTPGHGIMELSWLQQQQQDNPSTGCWCKGQWLSGALLAAAAPGRHLMCLHVTLLLQQDRVTPPKQAATLQGNVQGCNQESLGSLSMDLVSSSKTKWLGARLC